MGRKVIIVGGGVAGISAAVHCISRGFTPVIIEKNRHLGGRVRSFFSTDLNMILDNGQHVLSSAYHETRNILKILGTEDRVLFQKKFAVTFVRNQEESLSFRALSLPSPFHFFVPLLLNRHFSGMRLSDIYHFMRGSLFLSRSRLNQMTVEQWLDYTRQNATLRELLWNPLSLSILNTPVENASAALLWDAISRSFLGSRKTAGLGIPGAWLSDIFAGPAERYIRDNGGEIIYLNSVQSVDGDGERMNNLRTQKKQILSPWVISTLPPFSLHRILEKYPHSSLSSLKNSLARFTYHPIMTVNIVLREPMTIKLPASVVGSPIQWIFEHPGNAIVRGHYGYALVVSAADAWLAKSREAVMKMVSAELQRLLGIDLQAETPVIEN